MKQLNRAYSTTLIVPAVLLLLIVDSCALFGYSEYPTMDHYQDIIDIASSKGGSDFGRDDVDQYLKDAKVLAAYTYNLTADSTTIAHSFEWQYDDSVNPDNSYLVLIIIAFNTGDSTIDLASCSYSYTN
jgi:hypothetical protein